MGNRIAAISADMTELLFVADEADTKPVSETTMVLRKDEQPEQARMLASYLKFMPGVWAVLSADAGVAVN